MPMRQPITEPPGAMPYDVSARPFRQAGSRSRRSEFLQNIRLVRPRLAEHDHAVETRDRRFINQIRLCRRCAANLSQP